jgi:hypothetical protein
MISNERNTKLAKYIAFVVVLFMPFFIVLADVVVTPYWLDFYGGIKIAGQEAEQGTSIRVFDGDDVLCGETTVDSAGGYGFMPVYGDDPSTADIDEGAEEGERLVFRVNGVDVVLSGGQEPVWTTAADKKWLDLSILETAVRRSTDQVPADFELFDNYPNPFNPETVIRYALPASGGTPFVRLVIYNILGEKIKTLVEGTQATGIYSIKWDGTDDAGRSVSAGVYMYRLQAGPYIRVKKMLSMH